MPIKVGQTPDALFEPSPENAASGDYPIARLLSSIHVNKRAGEPLDTLTARVPSLCPFRRGAVQPCNAQASSACRPRLPPNSGAQF